MADVEEPQFTSLSQRIAALNHAQVGQTTSRPQVGKRPPPPPPPSIATNRPTLESRSQTVNVPPLASHGSSVTRKSSNLPDGPKTLVILPPPPVDRDTPALPPRKNAPPPLPGRKRPPPALPARQPSNQLTVRRGSGDSAESFGSALSTFSTNQSVASSITSTSSTSTVGKKWSVPPPFEQSKLPQLPPSRREAEEKRKLEKEQMFKNVKKPALISARTAPVIPQYDGTPSLPPRLPSRANTDRPIEVPQLPQRPAARKLPPADIQSPLPSRRPEPRRPASSITPSSVAAPVISHPAVPPPIPTHSRPPIPFHSRPLTDQITKPSLPSKPAAAAPTVGSSCLTCRDFSGPDELAAQYPRESLQYTSSAYLAEVLCGPFGSPTNKARAIFTWLHHNVAYDAAAFFGGNVRGQDPEETISKGLAVCSGYSGLFAAIAMHAGLECVVVGGHGKGYGYKAMVPGEPVPPYSSGHAWNAVKIDSGEWKLIDCCWGAGNISGQTYNKDFTPAYFTMSNDDFGLKHFPENSEYFFRSDGRALSWEEYFVGPVAGERVGLCPCISKHGILESSFSPAERHLRVDSAEVVRFQFSKVCEHWDSEVHGDGKPYLLVLKVGGIDGRKDDFIPLEKNDFWWWIDVPSEHLGAPGQTVHVYALMTFDGKDARGLTKEGYLAKKGRCGYSFQGLAAWELV